ncbi:MAG: hydroxymethylbilane synthase [Schleiferiaceae bacterium]|nr:hydroxymethylbilane synthase [Schleiferiaceae bacterium]
MSTIRIGTRDSELALWQANWVAEKLQQIGVTTELVLVKATGDLNTTTPLHQMGGTGLFTKVLDEALLNNQVDIAVHSLKDYPTVAPIGLTIGAVLERANPFDILVPKTSTAFLNSSNGIATIATGSIRRRAQWNFRFPNHKMENLRGNVNTRLQKLQDNAWDGAIFAAAGLERIHKRPDTALTLDWMTPAPAQGIVAVGCRQSDASLLEVLHQINDTIAHIQSTVERQFLNTLEGGCSAPIGALLQRDANGFHFKGVLSAIDGSAQIEVTGNCTASNYQHFGKAMAHECLAKGGEAIMKTIRHAGL